MISFFVFGGLSARVEERDDGGARGLPNSSQNAGCTGRFHDPTLNQRCPHSWENVNSSGDAIARRQHWITFRSISSSKLDGVSGNFHFGKRRREIHFIRPQVGGGFDFGETFSLRLPDTVDNLPPSKHSAVTRPVLR